MKPDEVTALALELGTALREAGLIAATAESCTGGGVAEAITRIPGSSAWFDRGFVTYSNEAKRDLLGVDYAQLNDPAIGAVSEATVKAMARGALAHSGAQVAVAVTGIAGPDGGSVEKPVGLVWFAWMRNGGDLLAEKRIFGGDREGIRAQSVAYALRGMLELLRRP